MSLRGNYDYALLGSCYSRDEVPRAIKKRSVDECHVARASSTECRRRRERNWPAVEINRQPTDHCLLMAWGRAALCDTSCASYW